MVYDVDTGETLFDCLEKGRREIVAKGGKGGLGNAALDLPQKPQPRPLSSGKARPVAPVKAGSTKVLADVGLVGRPNAGKSTFLSTVSRARPKIADYPFTTTRPYLGIVKIGEGYESFVMADIPGLIEGSHTGKGLGIKFLKHIERTKVLAILVSADCPDPAGEAKMLVHELSQYSPILAEKPKCFIMSKADILSHGEKPRMPKGWFLMSSATGAGVSKVLAKFKKMLDAVEQN